MLKRLLVFALLFFSAGCFQQHLSISHRVWCEGRAYAVGIDSPHPRLSWELTSDYRGDHQTAYQILVASSQEKLDHDCGDLWDTSKVLSDSPLNHSYEGMPLHSDQVCFCKVRVWDQHGVVSPWTYPWEAGWTMGLLNESDWRAKWITAPNPAGPLPIFRKTFTLDKPIRGAVLHISGLGQYKAFIDGRSTSSFVLQPGWTDYSKTVLYDDRRLALPPGEHVLSVMLANGMYNQLSTPGRYEKFVHSYGPPKLIAQLDIEYADGTRGCVMSDDSWKVAAGPITFSGIYGGEDYDARREQRGWAMPGFDDGSWAHAKETSGPDGRLMASSRSALTISVMHTFTPKAVTHPRPGIDVYDMEQNCAMMPVITVRGEPGSRVRIMPSELLNANGLATQKSTGGPVYFTYTLRGGGDETWRPWTTYMGSRYFQIETLPNDDGDVPEVVKVAGNFISSDSPAAGEFECSNELFDRTNELIRWAMRSNMVSILTDCPHRERLGWLEEDYLNGPGLMYNFSLPVLFEKIAGDMDDAQLLDGLVPDIAPEYTQFDDGFRDSPEWGSACVLVPWQAYEWYGDVQILRNSYAMMQRYVGYLGTKARDHILSYGLGDWFDIGPRGPGVSQLTPQGLTATAIYYHDVRTLAQIAKVLNDPAEAKKMEALGRQIRTAFNERFYNPDTHQYGSGSQTSNAMPLVFDMEPPGDAAAILANIVADVRKHDNSLTAGDVGYRYVLEALANGKRSDVIFDMNNQTSRPGYGYQLAHGATSLTEAWDGRVDSQDHFMLGHIMQWFYGDLAGIRQMQGSVAFEHIQIKPTPVGDIRWAHASYDSVRGIISSTWHKTNHEFDLEIQIPPGADATVFIPASSRQSVRVSGQDPQKFTGVHWLRPERGVQVFWVNSGHYQFTAH